MHRLFNWLLNYFLFAGTMFFAAGAVADLSGGGDGQAEGISGRGDQAGGPDADDGDGESGVSDSDIAEGQDGQHTGSESEDPNALADLGDGRKVPAKYAELFKGDKFLRDLFFSQATLRRTFPGGVKEAVEFSKKVEEIGGIDGIEQLQADLSVHSKDAELFEQNPAKWIEQAFTENAENSLSAWQHSLSLVADKYPEQFDFAVAPFMVETLDANGAIHSAYNKLAASADANDKAIAAKLAELYNGLKAVAKNAPKKPVQSENKEKQELQAEKENLRNQKINVQAVPYMNSAIEKGIDKAAQQNGFDLGKLKKEQANRYARFTADVKSQIQKEVLADEKWLDRYSAALASGNLQKCIRMVNARHDQALEGNGSEQGIAARVFAEWFGTGKPKVQPKTGDKTSRSASNGNAGGGKSVLHVTAMPSPKDIDYSHPQTRVIDQIAMRKDGKLVSWAS